MKKEAPKSSRLNDIMNLELFLFGGAARYEDSHGPPRPWERLSQPPESPDDLITGSVSLDPKTGEITTEDYTPPITRREYEARYANENSNNNP